MPSLLPPASDAGCPRCGGELRREKRLRRHRLISLIQPVKFYQCERRCGWSGLLSSRTGIEQRNRKLLLIMAVSFSLGAIVLMAMIITESLAAPTAAPEE